MSIKAALYTAGALLIAVQAHAGADQETKPLPAPRQAAQQASPSAEARQPYKSLKEKTGYAIGVDIFRNFKRQYIETDTAAVIQGMQDASTGKELVLSDNEIKKLLKDYNLELKSKQTKARLLLSEDNAREGKAYFLKFKEEAGVVTLKDGLQYKILKAGSGQKPGDNDAVTIKYRGTLINGTEVDSSDDMGFPITFYVKDSTIEGWKQALKLMPAGSKWQVVIPPHLGFGEKGAGRDIGPNATLIYDIELLAVNPLPVNKK